MLSFFVPPPPAGPWRSHIANRGTSFRICSQRLSVQWLSMATSHRWWKHVARSDIGKVYFGVRGKEFLPMIRIWISYLDKLWVLAFMPLGTKIHKDTTFNLNSQSIVFFSAAQEQNLQLTENFTIKALKQRIVYLPGLPAPVMGKRENATPFFSAQKGLSCGSGGATHWHHRCAPRIDACRTNWRLWDLGADSFWVWENESFCNFAVLRCFVFFKGWSKLILVDFGISQESKQHPFWQGGKTCNYRLLQATSIAMCEARKRSFSGMHCVGNIISSSGGNSLIPSQIRCHLSGLFVRCMWHVPLGAVQVLLSCWEAGDKKYQKVQTHILNPKAITQARTWLYKHV